MSPRSRSISSSRRSSTRSPRRRSSHSRRISHRRYESRSGSESRPPPPSPPAVVESSERYSVRSHSFSRSPSRHQRRAARSRSRSSRSRSPHVQRRSTRDKPTPSSCIGVFGLNCRTTQRKIRDIFSRFGTINRIQVVTDAQTGISRGFCFIYYEDIASARAAKDSCSGMEVDGRRMRVDFSITHRPHSPTPGVYKGEYTLPYYERRFRRSSRSNYRSHRRTRSRSFTPPRSSRY